MAAELIAAVSPVARRVRAYFAPVNRSAAQATIWDPSGIASFNPCAPPAPAPWRDLGWCRHFERKSNTKNTPLITGAPGVAVTQVRTVIDAAVSLEFESWGKLQMALASGVQQMNVLAVQSGAAANGSGGTAIAAVSLTTGSTATTLNVGTTAAAAFSVGQMVAVDIDYAGTTGFVGSGLSGGYVKNLAAIGADVDYVRRITLNVGRIVSIANGVLTLGAPLLAGIPTSAMKVSTVAAFCDREGGSFFQEWSALFLVTGEQGDRVAFHYPRLQAISGAAETNEALTKSPLELMRLAGNFRALPVADANDGESVVCFRSYLPAVMRAI
jgi:hypothetical protein